MSHTNVTPNYNLPQYVGTDIINPLTDTNGAYSDIDTALKNIADGVADGASKIETLENTVGDANGGLVKSVGDLQTQNGDAVLTTTAQTLSGAVNELDNEVNTNTGNISTLVQKVGSDTLDTVATTCTGAINEIVGKFTGKFAFKETLVFEVNGDGVKTVGALLDEAYALFSAYYASHQGEVYQPNSIYIQGVTPAIYLDRSTFVSGISFIKGTNVNPIGSTNSVQISYASANASGSSASVTTLTSGSITVTDKTSTVVANGNVVSIAIDEFVAI